MKTKHTLTTLAVLGTMALSANAFAEQIYIDRGIDLDGDGNTITTEFSQLGFGQWRATSIYQDLDLSGGLSNPDSIYDTNIQANLVAIAGGPGPVSFPALGGGGTVTINTSITTGNASFTALLPLVSFLDSTEGFDGLWNLTTQYELFGNYGELVNNGKPFNTGYFDIFLNTNNNPGDELKVLTLAVNGSDLQVGNLNIFGTVSYAAPNFFNFYDPDATFASIVGSAVNINWLLDTNVDPPIPVPSQLAVVPNGAAGDYFIRQTQLDGSIEFQRVPEPTTTALLALGLLGLGAVARKKKQSL